MSEEELYPEETGENTMLREAVDALRQGDRARARDLLTRLLKTDQKNPTYWVWLSAAVDSPKERIYCLQTALQADHQNAAAKRGLILLGALPPDDSVTPFPVNRPRLWEEKLTPLPVEKTHGWANPLTRTFMIFGIAMAALALFVGGYMLWPRGASVGLFRTPTRRPTITITLTPSATPVIRTATPTFLGPTPLAYFLDKTYTPTPLYVLTEHPIITNETFRAGLRFLANGDYETARVQFDLVLDNEPDAADVLYYYGETYRAEGDYRTARDYYQEAINADTGFAPAFVGRARANLGINPDADVSEDLNNAISLDSQYAEAYLERGVYRLRTNPSAAESDLETATELTPGSALAWMYLAEAQLALSKNDEALASALRANQLDLTLVPNYLTMARAYIATGQTDMAVGVLQTYTIYEPSDAGAFLQLGQAYNAAGEYQMAVDVLNKAIDADRRNPEAFYHRGYANLLLGNANLAEADFKMAVGLDPFDFNAHLGLARAYYLRGLPGDAYIQAETNVIPLAESDWEKAQVYYWQSIFLNEMDDEIGERASWYRLLALPADVMPEEWRNEAYLQLNITPTFTPTPKRTKTPTP